jgi:uncharacterized membrane protein
METELWVIALVIGVGVIGALAPIYLKRGSSKINIKNLSTIYKNKNLIIGIGIYGFGTVVFIPALKFGELSVLYPIVGLSYAWVCLFSKIMLKEKITPIKWLGIAMIIFGVALIGIGI